jgi:hypothetical protein
MLGLRVADQSVCPLLEISAFGQGCGKVRPLPESATAFLVSPSSSSRWARTARSPFLCVSDRSALAGDRLASGLVRPVRTILR